MMKFLGKEARTTLKELRTARKEYNNMDHMDKTL